MQVLHTLLLAVQILSALGMIGLILLQHGKGADMGAAFGSGASGSLFGATGSANFLSRTTAVLAAVFFVCTLTLAWAGNRGRDVDSGSVLERSNSAVTVPAPAASGAAAQIPGSVPAPAASGAAAPAAPAPATPASGAAQIPAK